MKTDDHLDYRVNISSNYLLSSIIHNKYDRIMCKSIEHIYYSVTIINFFRLKPSYAYF